MIPRNDLIDSVFLVSSSRTTVGLWPPLTLIFPYALLAEVGISLGRVVVPTTFPDASLVEVWILALDLQGKGNKRMILFRSISTTIQTFFQCFWMKNN